jgi:maternal-effect protein exuperantia
LIHFYKRPQTTAMPEQLGTPDQGLVPGQYQVVAWDLDTTGRRLIDEICQIGGFYKTGAAESEDNTFSQYVMPYRNPNPGARRSFGIKVVNIGRYRMLKDLNTGKILKTKSEVSALQDFLSWLGRAKAESDGVILICHEPQRKVLVPLLLEALYKYNLLPAFTTVVKGFCNTSTVVSELGDKEKITSLSLRSLCKTVLGDTNLPTNSATDRCRVLVDILATVTQGNNSLVNVDKIIKFTQTVQSEESQLKSLKDVLGTQGTLRPIFESQLKQKRLVRERAMNLRRTIAEAGLDYSALEAAFKDGSIRNKLEPTKAPTDDIDEIVKLIEEHFTVNDGKATEAKVKDPVAVNGSS